MLRAAALEAMLLALRALVPVSGLMIVLTVCWTYALMIGCAFWALAWVIDQIVSLLIQAC